MIPCKCNKKSEGEKVKEILFFIQRFYIGSEPVFIKGKDLCKEAIITENTNYVTRLAVLYLTNLSKALIRYLKHFEICILKVISLTVLYHLSI